MIEGLTCFTSSSSLISDNINKITYVNKQDQKYFLLNVFSELYKQVILEGEKIQWTVSEDKYNPANINC